MEYDEGDEHSDIYAHTIFVFNVVLMAIVASLGIVGNGLVLTLLHDCNVYMNTSQNIIGKIFDALIIMCKKESIISMYFIDYTMICHNCIW